MSSEKAAREYSIERLTAETVKDVEQLHTIVYGRSAPKDYFKIKYDSAYTGLEYVGYLAYNTDRIPVAYYGVIPCFLQCGDEQVLSAQSADTMTHPQFRYKGMFVELSNITFDLCRRSGIRLIFGFPNQNSYHGAVNKLGWKMTHTMACFLIPVKAIPLVKLARKTKASNAIYRVYKNIILKKYKTSHKLISNSVLAEGHFGVVRNAAYANAKDYYEREVLNLCDELAWCKTSNEFVLGDLNVTSENFKSVMDKLQSIAAKLGIQQMQFHASPGTQLHALFAKRYKSTISFPALFQQFDMNIDISKVKFTLADIDIF